MHPTQHRAASASPVHPPAEAAAHAVAADVAPELGACALSLAVEIARAAAYKWAYFYLQDRMESIGRHGWAHDCDGEIEYRISHALEISDRQRIDAAAAHAHEMQSGGRDA